MSLLKLSPAYGPAVSSLNDITWRPTQADRTAFVDAMARWKEDSQTGRQSNPTGRSSPPTGLSYQQALSTFSNRLPPGQLFGIEIESEGIRRTAIQMLGPWDVKRDSSLRGEHQYEYVTKPMEGDNLLTALYMYTQLTDQQGTERQLYSWRCATHVHINLLNLDFAELATLGLVSFASDNFFYALGAEARRDNYNCRPVSLLVSSAETIGNMAKLALRDEPLTTSDSFFDITSPDERYCGMNWHALQKFGTLEVRHFPGTNDMDLIVSWIEACADMYKACQEYTFDQMAGLINEGPSAFGPAVFGDRWERMSYAESARDWREMMSGFEHLMAIVEQPDEGTLDAELRKHMVIN